MKSYLTLAWKELKAQKITAILILVAVIMSTIMTTVVGQSIGILQSMRIGQAAGLNGNRYATFHQLSMKQAQKLHKDNRLYDVGDTIFVGGTPLGNSSLTLYLREYHDNALSMYPAIGNVKEGRLPEEANEIALSEDALQYLGLNAVIGNTVSLDLRASVMDGSLPELEYSADFVLTGILESSYIGYASGTVEGIVGDGTAEELLPEEYLLYSTDFKTYDKQNFQSIIYALAENLNVDERYIQYNWVLLDAIGISYDEATDNDTGTGFSFMTAACILVGVLVLLAAGLVIYNILKISITKRIKEYGTLRAIGGERGQIYRLVSLQLLILCGAGIPVGLLLGTLSAKGVLIAATGVLNPDLFMANSISELNSAISAASTVKLPMLSASIAVTLLFALLAAFPAARYASHISPTVAMSGQAVKIKRRVKRNRKIRNFESYYARLNLKRGRGRTVVTILSLVMSITVFVALQSFTGLLDTSSSVQDMYFSDYAITNETVGIPAEAVEALKENNTIERISTTRLSVFMPGAGDELPFETDLSVQSHETLQIVNVDEAQLQLHTSNRLSDQNKQALNDGTGCFVKNPIAFSYGDTPVQHTVLAVGDTIWLRDKTLRVVGLIDTPITINKNGFANGVQLIVNDEIYRSLLGNDNYSEVYPTLQDNADTDAFESWLDNWCSEYPGTHWLSYLQSRNEMAESFEQIRMLCWVLIVFIGIIGILNIINTVYSNIHTRVGEIGMQRAIGMSAASLYKTFLWEGAYYGIFASVVGAVLGYICCIFVGAVQTDALQLVSIPAIAIIEAAIISITACLLATAIPLRSIAKMNIVDSIEAIE
ncbi:MAG: FtsX-like permease family protein [Eubacteriales bacterium]|nr:FtsX-like permease family protein [Eubacteriales bacterium]